MSFKIALFWVVTPVIRLKYHKMCVMWSGYDAEYDTELVAVSNIPT